MQHARHPISHVQTVTCSSCGAVHELRSTRAAITIDTCSECHPAYTGRERPVAGGSRVTRFERRRALARA
jgi:large subunit ribosomal protein L31